MKKNNKGFMLVEVVIVTVVVATIMTSLYILFNRVYNAYDKKIQYTNIDSIYALKMLESHYIEQKDSAGNIIFNNLIKENNNFSKIECNETDEYCKSLFEKYNINSMYLVKNNQTSFEDLKKENINESFKDYIDYLLNIRSSEGSFNESGKIYSDLLIIETYTVDIVEGEDGETTEEKKKTLNKYAYLPTGIIK